ncbi:MAG: polyprenol phosphomannose-dependent alpha 1,6 mannosyltransferase MptB [Mycobacteriales bacterium]
MSAVRTLRWPALIGLVATAALVVADGRAATPVGVTLAPSFGWLVHPATDGGTASVAVALSALATLVVCWWRVLHLAADRAIGLRSVGVICSLWLLPVLFAQPLLSLDAYAYLAHGSMLAHGLDPYSGGPVLLGDDPAVARVDPMWRASPVPYGPLALLLLRAIALAQGNVITGVLLLRLLALLGVFAGVAVALRLSPPHRRPYVMALCALNPITLVHLVGGGHVDAVLGGVVALSLLALQHQRRWLSWLLAATAAAIKITIAPLLLFLLFGLLRQRAGRGRRLLIASALGVLPFLAAMPVIERPWGFLAALTVPGDGSPWYAPATLVGDLLVLAGRLIDLPVGDGPLRWVARGLVLGVGAVVVLRLLRADRRDHAADGQRSLQRVALALLVVVLCLPALYSWYLAAGLFVLAAVGNRTWTTALIAASSVLTFSSLPSIYSANHWLVAGAVLLALAILGVGLWRSGRLVDLPAAEVVPIAPVEAPVGVHTTGHRGLVRLTQVAGVALLAPVAFGLLSPGASAETAVENQQTERVRAVAQLRMDYPDLQIVSMLPVPGSAGSYDVELVWPTGPTCRLRLIREDGPYAPFHRGDVPRSTGAPGAPAGTCPPPAAVPGRPDRPGRQGP